ncbi:hypothetical protein KC330_g40 [Hortaea werneckii]|nr:hypothetical protein KC330_g40 [Hortaea werneckii]
MSGALLLSERQRLGKEQSNVTAESFHCHVQEIDCTKGIASSLTKSLRQDTTKGALRNEVSCKSEISWDKSDRS